MENKISTMLRKNDQSFKIDLESFINRTGMSNFDPDHIDLIQKMHMRCETNMNCEMLWIQQNMTSLQEAVIHHSLVEVKQLLIGGVDINALDWSGVTPLSTAVICNFQDGIKVLLNSGACVNVNDHWGLTPLHYAIICQNLQLVDYLLSRGADINLKNQGRGETILNWAARSNLTVRVNFILDRGADPNLENYDGCVPLFYACHHENLKMVESIIRKGADVNHKSNHGWTALHVAAKANSLEVVRLLLLSGADPNARTVWGIAPLHYAKPGLPLISGLTPLVETLLMGGASINFPYNSNLTLAEYYQSCCKMGALKCYNIELETANLNHMMCKPVQEIEPPDEHVDKKVEDHSELCETELSRMKRIRFGSTSLYKVLASLNNHSVKFVRNSDLGTFIDSPLLRKRCPIYCTLIKEAFGRAQIRQKLEDIIMHQLLLNGNGIGKLLCSLPNEIMTNICSYLEDKDLGNFVKSFDL